MRRASWIVLASPLLALAAAGPPTDEAAFDLESMRLRDVQAWPEERRAMLLEQLRDDFPDDWQLDAGFCRYAYGHPANHSRVFAVLLNCGPAAEPLFEDFLEDRRELVRVNAAFVLRDALDPERRLKLLERAMNDEEPLVREVAAGSIEAGCVRDGRAVLHAHLDDDDAFVRRRVAIALSSWGDAGAIPALIDSIGLDGRYDEQEHEVLAYEQAMSGGVLEVLERLTLRSSRSDELASFEDDGTEEDRRNWKAWWTAAGASFSVREAYLRSFESPSPGRPSPHFRVIARLDDADVTRAAEQDVTWRQDFGCWLAREREPLRSDREVLADPLQCPHSTSVSKVARRSLSEPALRDELLLRGDLPTLGNIGFASLAFDPEAQAALHESLVRAAAVPDARWTEPAVRVVGILRRSEDCELLAQVSAPDLARAVADAAAELGCPSTR